jgi:hypothetical protein
LGEGKKDASQTPWGKEEGFTLIFDIYLINFVNAND